MSKSLYEQVEDKAESFWHRNKWGMVLGGSVILTIVFAICLVSC